MRVMLTDRFVQNANPRPDKIQSDYFDKSIKGLFLRASNSGKGHKTTRAFNFAYTSPLTSKRAQVALGTYPTTDLATARTKALEARRHVEEGRDPRHVSEADGVMTVTGLVGSYIEKHASTLRSGPAIARRLHKCVVPVIGPMRVTDLHRRDINRVVDPVLKRGRPTEAVRGHASYGPMGGRPRRSRPKRVRRRAQAARQPAARAHLVERRAPRPLDWIA
jgi:Arm domain-containing DNA-binding protein